MSRVLVLRDREAALETAEDLARRGHRAILLPVQAIEPSRDPPPAGDFAGLVVTSRNAVPALRRHGPSLPREPILAVGDATAAELRAAGLPAVETGSGTADGLVAPATALARRTGRALLLALGRRRASALEEAFRAAGVSFAVWEAYATHLLRPARPAIAAALGGRAPDAVLLLSQGQAEGFAALVTEAPELFRPLPRLCCLSARVAAALPEELRAAVSISPTPEIPPLFDRIAGTSFQPNCLAGAAGGATKTG